MAKRIKNVQVEAGGLSTTETQGYMEKTNNSYNGGMPDELTEEQKQYARITVRKEFNENFSKWANMPEDDADDAYIELTKKDFETAIDETRNKLFVIADSERAIASAELLKEMNSKMFRWSNAQWKGVITFDKVITKLINELKSSKDELKVDYSTLMYLYASMKEPNGIGIEEAKIMAKYENYDIENDCLIEEDSPVTYSGINEAIQRNIQWLSSNDKKLNILKERVNFAYAGIKMELKITELEEFLEFYDAINARAIDNNPEVQQQLGQ